MSSTLVLIRQDIRVLKRIYEDLNTQSLKLEQYAREHCGGKCNCKPATENFFTVMSI